MKSYKQTKSASCRGELCVPSFFYRQDAVNYLFFAFQIIQVSLLFQLQAAAGVGAKKKARSGIVSTDDGNYAKLG